MILILYFDEEPICTVIVAPWAQPGTRAPGHKGGRRAGAEKAVDGSKFSASHKDAQKEARVARKRAHRLVVHGAGAHAARPRKARQDHHHIDPPTLVVSVQLV